MPAALFAAFGLFGASLITTLTGFSNDYLWLPLAVLSGLIVWWLVYRGISLSTRVAVALGAIEIGIFLLVSTLLIVNAGSKNTISVFLPGADGLKPALQGMVFCLLAFVGFEAAAPLAEETRDPKRTIRRAVLLSAVLIGLFYIYNMYAATVCNPIKHLVIPILGIVLLIPAFLGVLGGLTIPILDIKLDPLKPPYDIVPLGVLIWMVIGVVAYFVLRSRDPEAVNRVGDVMTEG